MGGVGEEGRDVEGPASEEGAEGGGGVEERAEISSLEGEAAAIADVGVEFEEHASASSCFTAAVAGARFPHVECIGRAGGSPLGDVDSAAGGGA